MLVQLAPVNKNLEAYYDAWHKLIDSWVVIEVDDPNWVFRWRLQVIDVHSYPINMVTSILAWLNEQVKGYAPDIYVKV